mmetsp:Transcript_24299/g.52449  ORF Transcript_24299/g.52449 Transcript_24299/m.52449 type:complete len:112 (-) Transcript_24299:482-817(-)
MKDLHRQLIMAEEEVLAVGGGEAVDEGSAPQTTQDLTVFVQTLLQQMQSRFATMSDAIIGRIDEMGHRIDELENSIGELMAQAGIEDEAGQEGTTPAEDGDARSDPLPPAH